MLRHILLAATSALAPVAAPVAAKPAVPTVQQLAAFPTMSSFTLSDDGKHMAALEARGEDRVILVWKTDNLKAAPTVIGASQMKIQGVQFIKNDLLAVSLWQPYDARFDGVTKTFVTKLFITDLEGKNWREPMPLPRAKTEIEERAQSITVPTLLNSLPNDPDNIIVVNNIGDDAGDVYKVNIRTGRAERVQRSDDQVFGYFTDLEGNLRARNKGDIDSRGFFVSTQFRNPQTLAWEEHFRSYVKERDVVDVVGIADNGTIAFLRTNVGHDKTRIVEYDITQRKLLEPLFAHRYFDADRPILFPYKDSPAAPFGEIVGLSYEGPRTGDVQWIAPQFAAIDKAIREALKLQKQQVTFVDPATGATSAAAYDMEKGVRVTDYSRDLKTVLFTVSGGNQPPLTYMLRDGKLDLLANSYPSLNPGNMGPTSLVYYKARDGLDVPAFLTTPNTELCGPGPWPAVVHPHGGPWARDDADFDGSMWVPLMSTRCIAVLRPQYRGSDGWGRKIWVAGDAEWGQKMQDDKDDGAKWMINQKIAIPGRVAMFGFSYGGYASFAAAVRPNDLYKCSIAGAGVSDIRKIWERFYTNAFFRDRQAPTVKGMSPVDYADQIKIPIMVYHGERDQTVPIEQSQWFVDKAKRAGKPVEYHEFADYGHGPAWTRQINAAQLQIIEDYLKKGCGGGGL